MQPNDLMIRQREHEKVSRARNVEARPWIARDMASNAVPSCNVRLLADRLRSVNDQRLVSLAQAQELCQRLLEIIYFLDKFAASAPETRHDPAEPAAGAADNSELHPMSRESRALGIYPARLRNVQPQRLRNGPAAEHASPQLAARPSQARAAVELSVRFVRCAPPTPCSDWLALRNKHSAWKNGHFHPSENHVDWEDYDDEIERQFPEPTAS
jgi:hypothetical protein